MSIALGDKVRDTLSGLEGTVVARTEWLYGCVRITIQPEGNKDGKAYETYTVDEPQLTVMETTTQPPATPRHGNRPDVGRRADPI